MMIFLDTGPLWTICNPGAGEVGKSLRKAVLSKMAAGHTIAVAEINDYEARREILRKNAQAQLARLEKMLTMAAYHPIDTALMKAAAALWAQLRNAGAAGADDHALDGDVILVAQALRYPDHLIVTDNVKHFSGLCNVQSRTDFLLS